MSTELVLLLLEHSTWAELECLPLQPVDLMPLPPNSAERLRVICNGRSAVLILRTQRVIAAGAEMSASRFETVCGKGDAKKWKSSIHLESAPGVPGQVSAANGASC